MKDDDFGDWPHDGETPREPGEAGLGDAEDAGADRLPPVDGEGFVVSPSAARFDPGDVRAQAVLCPSCQYNLTGVTIGTPCPECGLPVGSGGLGANAMPMSGRAIASLVLGIIGLVGCCMWGVSGVVCGGLAVVFSIGVKDQVLRGEVNPSSRGLATAGLVCGLIGLTLGGLVLGLLVVGLVMNP